MSSSLYKLGRSMARAPWRVIGVWAVIGVILGAVAVGLGGTLQEDIQIPGTESQDGLDMLGERFPEMSGTSGQFVFITDDGSSIDAHQADITRIMEDAANIDGVREAPDPFGEQAPGTRNDDDTAIIGNIQMDGDLGEFPAEALDELTELAEDSSNGPLTVHAGGQIFTQTTVPLSWTEVLGVLIALVVLAVTFRAIVPAVIPIVTAITGVAAAMAAVLSIAAGIDIPSVTPTLAIMLGLAVGIDYALFIVSRHRDQLREGMDVTESVGEALATSGSAVIFAGATVVIALVGLFVTGIPFLTLMGLASAFTVSLAVVIALTLLPAILGLLGERLRPRGARRVDTASHSADEPPTEPIEAASDETAPQQKNTDRVPLTTRWARLVTRAPIVTIVLVILAVTSLAIPAKDLRLGLPDMGTEPKGTMVRETYDLISDEFGAGYNAPLLLTADIINTTDPVGVVDELADKVKALDGVEAVQLATPNRGGDLAVIVIIPEGGQTSPATAELVHTLRDDRDQWEKDLTISDITVTGQTAATVDITQKLSDALLPFALFVVGLSLILLTMVFRSIWVPLKASIGYLISVGVAFGVVTMIFEYGWGNDALGIGVVGPVISFMPIIVMGVLFGLAMDYEVFLVSRMREDYVHSGDARGSVVTGFTASAGVVIAAALIMIAVFASFIPESTFMIQPIAVGLAVGVAVDAFVVRMTLVPAVLALLGDRAWHLPAWLDRMLPRLDVEGEGLVHVLEHRRWTEENGPAALRLDDVVVPLLDGSGTLGPLTGSISPGTLLVARSADDAVLRTFLALAAGRAKPDSGTVAMGERLLSEDMGAVQAHTILLERGDDVDAVLRRIPVAKADQLTLIVNSVDQLYPQSTEDIPDMGRRMEQIDTLLDAGLAIIVGSPADTPLPAEHGLANALRDPRRHVALAIHRTPTAIREGAVA